MSLMTLLLVWADAPFSRCARSSGGADDAARCVAPPRAPVTFSLQVVRVLLVGGAQPTPRPQAEKLPHRPRFIDRRFHTFTLNPRS
eukprot:6212314-Pleurochrysis_carterae.AAC.1